MALVSIKSNAFRHGLTGHPGFADSLLVKLTSAREVDSAQWHFDVKVSDVGIYCGSILPKLAQLAKWCQLP